MQYIEVNQNAKPWKVHAGIQLYADSTFWTQW